MLGIRFSSDCMKVSFMVTSSHQVLLNHMSRQEVVNAANVQTIHSVLHQITTFTTDSNRTTVTL